MTRNRTTYLLPVAAVAVTLVVLFFSGPPPAPAPASMADVRQEAARGGYRLITTDDLWQRYRSRPDELTLVDTRQQWEYRTGHIKGAGNFPMEPTALSRWQKKDDLERFLGPDRGQTIVFY